MFGLHLRVATHRFCDIDRAFRRSDNRKADWDLAKIEHLLERIEQ